MRVLGINAIFHDSSAALVVDGVTVAAAEEERFTRRKHAKQAVPFSAWELPEHAIAWCLAEAGLTGADLDAVAYSYDPDLVDHSSGGLDPAYEAQRTDYARRAPSFLQTLLPDYDPAVFRFVRHHVAHAASAGLAFGSPVGDCAVLAVDGRGEATSMLAGEYRDGKLDILADQPLPHSLGLLYEDLTMHLGFVRSSDEYKVMAMASYGKPRHRDHLRRLVHTTPGGGFVTDPVDWEALAPRRAGGEDFDERHADLAASVQLVLEDVLLELASDLHRRTGQTRLAFAGGVALNCVANTRLLDEGPFDELWVQPAAGDAGTALGAALSVAVDAGEMLRPFARRRSRAVLVGGGAGGDPDHRPGALRAPRRHRRGDGGRHRRQRGGGLVPGSLGVRPAGARASFSARRPHPVRQRRAAQRHQGPRAVPSGRSDGAAGACDRDLRARADPQPVHALRPRRPTRLARPAAGCHPRRRHCAGPDRRPGG